MGLFLRQRWMQMPEGPVQVDENCDLLHGIDVRAYLLFRQGSGGVFAEDVSGFGQHGLVGGVSVNWNDRGADVDGTGLNFDGGTDTSYVELDNTSNADAHTKPAFPITLAARFVMDSWQTTANPWAFVLNNRGTSGFYAGAALMGSLITAGRVALNFGKDTSLTSSGRETGNGSTTLTTGVTYSAGGVIRGADDMSLLIDGVAETLAYTGTGSTMAYSASSPSYVGRFPSAGGKLNGRMFWAMIAAGNPALSQLAELTRIPYAALTPIRPRLYSFPVAPAVGGGLSIPVAMHQYRRQRAA